MEMIEGNIFEQVEKMLPCMFPDEFKTNLESADKQTIRNLLTAHKNANFQKVFEGCRTRGRSRNEKILRAVELAFETDLENDPPSLDANQNQDTLQSDIKLSKSNEMAGDIHCSEINSGYSSICEEKDSTSSAVKLDEAFGIQKRNSKITRSRFQRRNGLLENSIGYCTPSPAKQKTVPNEKNATSVQELEQLPENHIQRNEIPPHVLDNSNLTTTAENESLGTENAETNQMTMESKSDLIGESLNNRQKTIPLRVKSEISDSDDDESRLVAKRRRKRKSRRPIVLVKSEISSDSSDESTDIEDY